jgi:predicted nucleic acid-binding protein
MIGNIFIDTNIFLYAKFDDGNEKFKMANDLFNVHFQLKKPFISTQVVNEFCNVNKLRNFARGFLRIKKVLERKSV